MAHENCRETVDLQMAVGKKLWAEEYNRMSKSPRKSREETLREIKTLKISYSYVITGRKYTQMPRKSACPEMGGEDLSNFILLMTRSHVRRFANILIDQGYRLRRQDY